MRKIGLFESLTAPLQGNTRPGLWIAIYGPDGAGKSAIAERLVSELNPFFRTTHRHHLRLHLLRRRRSTEPVTDPHAQPPRGILLSWLKLLYLFADYWLAHLFVVLPRLAAGHLVIFDRYFDDHAIDPRRYRLAAASVPLAAKLRPWVPRPDLSFVLDVSPQNLARRKGELALREYERQRREYVQKLASSPNTICVDAERSLDSIADELTSEVLRCLNLRRLLGTKVAHAES